MPRSNRRPHLHSHASRATLICVAIALGVVLAPSAASAVTVKSVPTPTVSEIGMESALFTVAPGTGFAAADQCTIRTGPQDSGLWFDQQSTGTWRCDSGGTLRATNLRPGMQVAYAVVQCNDVVFEAGRFACRNDPALDDYRPACEQDHLFDACPKFTTLASPTLTATGAQQVRSRTATLTGTINVLELSGAQTGSVRYLIEYADNPGFANARRTETRQLPQDLDPYTVAPISFTVGALTPGSTYHYRVVLYGDGEMGWTDHTSTAVSFETLGAAATLPATNVEATTATFNGRISTDAAAVKYHWLLGSNPELTGSTVELGFGSVPAGTEQELTFNQAGLTPGWTYHVALVVDGKVSTPMRFVTPLAVCPDAQKQLANQPIGTTGLSVTGCWTQEQGVHVGHGPVTINGLRFEAPVTAYSVRIDPARRTLTATKGYTVTLGPVVLYPSTYAALDLAFATSDGSATFELPQVPVGSKLYGLAIGGINTVTTTDGGGASINIAAINLPSILADVTAQATVDIDHSGIVGAVTARAGAASIGPFSLPDLTLRYDLEESAWFAKVWLKLPKADTTLGGEITIKDGKLVGIGGEIDEIKYPLFPGFYMTGGSFYSLWHPNFILEGLMKFQTGAVLPPHFTGTAGFNLTFDGNHTIDHVPGIPNGTKVYRVPTYLKLNGLLALGDLPLGEAQLRYYGLPGKPFGVVNGRITKDLTVSCVVSGRGGVVPSLDVAASMNSSAFNLTGSGQVEVKICVDSFDVRADVIASSRGMAMCGQLGKINVGVGGTWPVSENFQLYTAGGCNIGTYSAPIDLSGVGRAAQDTSGTVRIPPGLPGAVIKIEGKGGAIPIVQLTGPKGLSITMPSTPKVQSLTNRWLVLPDGTSGTTFITLKAPHAGTYRVAALGGSIVTKVTVAHEEPAPHVTATLRTTGASHAPSASRTLTWTARNTPKQRLVIREIGAAGERTLVTTTKLRGSITFRPKPGLRGDRSIVVDVYKYGSLHSTTRLLTYRGPVLKVPARPARVTVTRRHATVRVRWTPTRPRAHQYRVLVRTADGRRQTRFTRRPSLVLRSVPAGAITVRVAGIDSAGRIGRARTVTNTNVSARFAGHAARARAGRHAVLRYTTRSRTPIWLELRRGATQVQFVRVVPRRAGNNVVRITAPQARGTYTMRLMIGTTKLDQARLRVGR